MVVNHNRRPCECGCGEYPARKGSRFLPGHDLRKAYEEQGGRGTRRPMRPPGAKPAPSTGHCAHCKALCTKNQYCYGCKEFICYDCDIPYVLRHLAWGKGRHGPEDHLYRVVKVPPGWPKTRGEVQWVKEIS